MFPIYGITETGSVFKIGGELNGSNMIPVRTTKMVYGYKENRGWVPAVTLRYKYGINDKGERVEVLMKRKTIPIHRLMCMAYHGDAPKDKPWVKFKDGISENIHPSNLEWVSVEDTIKTVHESGKLTYKKGAESHSFGKKLSDEVKRKMSKSKTGENHPLFKGWYCFDGKKYTSVMAASKSTGFGRGVIDKYSKLNIKGWSFIEKESHEIINQGMTKIN